MADNVETPTPSGGGGEPTKTVAYENFQRVVEAKTGLEAQVSSLKGELQKLTEKAATVDTLSAQVREWQAKHAEAEGKFATYTEFSGALGTTDADVISTFDGKYRALPEADRPARSAWVESLKAKPEDAPAVLRPWLAPASPQQKAEPSRPQPRAPSTGTTPPSAPSSYSAEEVRRIREAAVKSGDWTAWKEMRKSFGGGR